MRCCVEYRGVGRGGGGVGCDLHHVRTESLLIFSECGVILLKGSQIIDSAKERILSLKKPLPNSIASF